MNTGEGMVHSTNGLLTTVAYQIAGQAPVYALEGSVAVAGALVQWLRDNLGIIGDASEVEALAATVEGNGGVYFVPAFSGLFAPHWRSDARGVVAGLTGYATKAHIARAALEATAFQTSEVLEAMTADAATSQALGTGAAPARAQGADTATASTQRAQAGGTAQAPGAGAAAAGALRVDGGMVANSLLMQFQADILARRVVRPAVAETTALGAAYAAGLATGAWSSLEELAANWRPQRTWEPQMSEHERTRLLGRWRDALSRTLDWARDP